MTQTWCGPTKETQRRVLKELADFKGYHDKYKSWNEWDNPDVHPVGNQVHGADSIRGLPAGYSKSSGRTGLRPRARSSISDMKIPSV